MNAKTFTESLAAKLTERGWNVKIDTDFDSPYVTESYSFFASTGRWYEATITGWAYKSARTGRWTFGSVRVYRCGSDAIKSKTYRDARVLVDVFGRENRQAVSA
jgi:hypothetical protein